MTHSCWVNVGQAGHFSTREALLLWLKAAGERQRLQLHELIEEERPGALCRAVAVFHKEGTDSHDDKLAGSLAVAAGVSPQHIALCR